jgi:hypothetical protein
VSTRVGSVVADAVLRGLEEGGAQRTVPHCGGPRLPPLGSILVDVERRPAAGRERATAKRRPRLARPLGDPPGDVVTLRRIDEAPVTGGNVVPIVEPLHLGFTAGDTFDAGRRLAVRPHDRRLRMRRMLLVASGRGAPTLSVFTTMYSRPHAPNSVPIPSLVRPSLVASPLNCALLPTTTSPFSSSPTTSIET